MVRPRGLMVLRVPVPGAGTMGARAGAAGASRRASLPPAIGRGLVLLGAFALGLLGASAPAGAQGDPSLDAAIVQSPFGGAAMSPGELGLLVDSARQDLAASNPRVSLAVAVQAWALPEGASLSTVLARFTPRPAGLAGEVTSVIDASCRNQTGSLPTSLTPVASVPGGELANCAGPSPIDDSPVVAQVLVFTRGAVLATITADNLPQNDQFELPVLGAQQYDGLPAPAAAQPASAVSGELSAAAVALAVIAGLCVLVVFRRRRPALSGAAFELHPHAPTGGRSGGRPTPLAGERGGGAEPAWSPAESEPSVPWAEEPVDAGDRSYQLSVLASMRDRGVLSNDEYLEARRRLLKP